MNYYEILGISRTATQAQIKKAYRELAKKWHPDVNQGNNVAADMFKLISEAYTVLSDPVTRAEYDQFLDNQAQTQQETESEFSLEQLFNYICSKLILGENEKKLYSELVLLSGSAEFAQDMIRSAKLHIKKKWNPNLWTKLDIKLNTLITKIPARMRNLLIWPAAILTFITVYFSLAYFFIYLLVDIPIEIVYFYQFLALYCSYYIAYLLGTSLENKFKVIDTAISLFWLGTIIYFLVMITDFNYTNLLNFIFGAISLIVSYWTRRRFTNRFFYEYYCLGNRVNSG